MEDALRCPVCSDVIGTYEPVIAVGGSRHRRTSLAREPQLVAGEDVILHHECAPDLLAGSGTTGGQQRLKAGSQGLSDSAK